MTKTEPLCFHKIISFFLDIPLLKEAGAKAEADASSDARITDFTMVVGARLIL
jgi:hypothetical protein